MLNSAFTISKNMEIHNGLAFLFYFKQDGNKATSLMYKQDQFHNCSKNQQYQLATRTICTKTLPKIV